MEHKHDVHDSDARFIINAITKAIKNDPSRKVRLIQYDHNSERFTFECPRYIEGHDMSLCNKTEIHFLNIDAKTKKSNSGHYDVTDLQISEEDENTVVCSWVVSRNATQLAGALKFLVKFRCMEDDVEVYAWHTDIFTGISVGEGINADESFETEYVDIIEQWKASVLQGFKDEFTEWKEKTETQVSVDINRWKSEALNTVDQYIDEHSEEWTNDLANANKQIGFLSNYVTPQMFGAKGDGVTDDCQAIQRMFDGIENGTVVYFPSGTYLMDTFGIKKEGEYGYNGAILLKKENITMILSNGAILKSIANENNTDFSSILCIDECNNIHIKGGVFVGELDEHIFDNEVDTTTFTQTGLMIRSSTNVVVEDVTSCNWIAGCIHVGGTPKSDAIEIRNCLAYHSHYHSIVIEGADNVRIINTEAYDANSNRDFGCSIDVEGLSATNCNNNIFIEGCVFGSSEASALNINKCKNVNVYNTIINDSALTVQPSENVKVCNCEVNNSNLIILQGGTKNVVFEGNYLLNSNVEVRIYSSDTNFIENVVIKNNTIVLNDSFDTFDHGMRCFNLAVRGQAEIMILNNSVMCSSGKICLFNSSGNDKPRKITIKGNHFKLGSDDNKMTLLYRDVVTFLESYVEFADNKMDIYLDESVTTISNGKESDILYLLILSPNGVTPYSVNGNTINIYGLEIGLSEIRLLTINNGLSMIPTTHSLDFMNNVVYSENTKLEGLLMSVGFVARVYNNIARSNIGQFINESQTGIKALNNICDEL